MDVMGTYSQYGGLMGFNGGFFMGFNGPIVHLHKWRTIIHKWVED